MNQFKALLESELLTEETKATLTEAVKAHEASLRESVRDELEVEYAAKLEDHKAKFDADMIAMVNESVDKEFNELREDVEKALSMESDYAAKLVEETAKVAARFDEEAKQLVEAAVDKEFEELREDLTESRKAHFGMKVFEAVRGAFDEQFAASEEGQALAEARKEAGELKDALQKTNTKLEEMVREKKVGALIEGLEGKAAKIMSAILEGTATDKLEERYEAVLESVVERASDEVEVIAESVESEVVVEEDAGKRAALDELRQMITYKA